MCTVTRQLLPLRHSKSLLKQRIKKNMNDTTQPMVNANNLGADREEEGYPYILH